MTAARPAALFALLLLTASCARKAEPPAAESGTTAWPPPESAPAAFIPDHLRGDWVVYAHRVIGETTKCRVQFYAISGERRLHHPAVIKITEQAQPPSKNR
jgi:hypothetical protein